jgi:uncharacterized protein
MQLANNREAIRRFGVRRLGIFGSHAREEATEESDLDFLVEFEQATLHNYMDLKEYLEQLFGRRVDLVFADALKPRLRPIILEETVYVPGL